MEAVVTASWALAFGAASLRGEEGRVSMQPDLGLPSLDDLAAERNMSRALLAALADGYVFAAGGFIVDVNEAFCRLTGYQREELIGLSRPYKFRTLEEVAEVVHQANHAKAPLGATVDCQMSRRDGSRFHAELTVRPVYLDNRTSQHADAAGDAPAGYVTVLRDVTRARAEHAEQLQTQRMLTEAQTQAKLGSWDIDLATGEVTVTPQMLNLCGLPEGSPAPTMREFQQFVHPDDRPGYQQFVRDAVRSGVRHSIEHRLQLADGTIRHIFGTATIERDPGVGTGPSGARERPGCDRTSRARAGVSRQRGTVPPHPGP